MTGIRLGEKFSDTSSEVNMAEGSLVYEPPEYSFRGFRDEDRDFGRVIQCRRKGGRNMKETRW